MCPCKPGRRSASPLKKDWIGWDDQSTPKRVRFEVKGKRERGFCVFVWERELQIFIVRNIGRFRKIVNHG